MKLKSALFKYLPSVLLVIVAGVHFILVGTMQISPWKGGGFGMFSTPGSPGMYLLRAYYNAPAKDVTINIPADLANDKNRIYHFPSHSRISALKQNLARKNWLVVNDTLATTNTQTAQGSAINMLPSDITVELWQLRFDAKAAAISTSLTVKY